MTPKRLRKLLQKMVNSHKGGDRILARLIQAQTLCIPDEEMVEHTVAFTRALEGALTEFEVAWTANETPLWLQGGK